MADALSTILGLQQQNAQQTNGFLNPNTAASDLDNAISQGQKQQQLDVSKGYLDLAGSAQAFQQDQLTKELAMKTQEFQNKQRLSDLLFPIQQNEAQNQINNAGLAADAYNDNAQHAATLGSLQISSDGFKPIAQTQIAQMSTQDLLDGKANQVINDSRLTPADRDQLSAIVTNRTHTYNVQAQQAQQFDDNVYQKDLEAYQNRAQVASAPFDSIINNPNSTPEQVQTAQTQKQTYLQQNGLAFPPNRRATYENGIKGIFRTYNAPASSSGRAVNPNSTTPQERNDKQAIDKLVQQRTALANQKNDLIKKNGTSIDTSGIDDTINKINKQIQSISPKAAFSEAPDATPSISPANYVPGAKGATPSAAGQTPAGSFFSAH